MARSGLVRRRGKGSGRLMAVWIRASPPVSLRSSASPSLCEGKGWVGVSGFGVIVWRLL